MIVLREGMLAVDAMPTKGKASGAGFPGDGRCRFSVDRSPDVPGFIESDHQRIAGRFGLSGVVRDCIVPGLLDVLDGAVHKSADPHLRSSTDDRSSRD
jgi:hypothetical protein